MMKIIFSKNNSKEISDAVEKIEIFQLETFLNVIGEKGKIESGPNYYLEEMYENSMYKSAYRHMRQKYKRNYAPKEKKKVSNKFYILLIFSIICIFISCDNMPTLPDGVIDYANIPTLVNAFFALGIISLIGFVISRIINIYNQKCVKTRFEIGMESELEHPEVFEMLLKLEESKDELNDIRCVVNISNNLEELCKYGATPEFSISEYNDLSVVCKGIETNINEITSFKMKGYITTIRNFGNEYIENTFKSDVVDFSWLDGKANSNLLSIAEICKDYEISFNNVNQLETHNTHEGECEVIND